MSALIYDYRIKPWEIYGGRRAFFVRYADLVANVVEELKLQPIQEQFRFPAVRAMEKQLQQGRRRPILIPICSEASASLTCTIAARFTC
jgi:hypothetical protein